MGRAGGIHPKTHDHAKSPGAHFKAQMQRRPLALTKIITSSGSVAVSTSSAGTAGVMEQLEGASKHIKVAHDKHERDYEECIAAQDEWKVTLNERRAKLNERKQNAEATYGNINVANDDLMTVNAGGRVISIKRSILTQQVGTRFEAIFSGRWDKKLLRDSDDTIFLDVNPDCFQAIVNYFGERMISSANDPPSPPTVEDELDHILQNQLELFGLVAKVGKDERHFKILHDSDIIEDEGLAKILHNWLKEADSDGEFTLLYRRSRDGLSKKAIHSKCDGKGFTITIIEAADGHIMGGYSNTSWSSSDEHSTSTANKAFWFALSGSSVSSPCKMKLKNANDPHAIFTSASRGAIFGHDGHAMSYYVGMSLVLYPGKTYHTGSIKNGRYDIKEVEVFQVSGSSLQGRIIEPVTRFVANINQAINANQACLLQAET